MKKTNNTFDLRAQVLKDPKAAQKNSWNWYNTNIRKVAVGMSVQKFLGDNIAHQTTSVTPGAMCGFFYDPKTKEDLPYYDTFPLLLPWQATSTHFIGLNLHYLQPRLRLVLLDKLLEIQDDKKLQNTSKIQFSWQTIKSFSELPQAKSCVKQYLFKQVKSRFIVIPQTDWYYTVVLPTERFKKKSAEYVWRQA